MSFRENGVTAHRGNPVAVPENTIGSFESAYRIGADFIETDVHRSADGGLFLCHDHTTGRTFAKDLVIAESTGAQLLELGLPTLEEALDWLTIRPGIRMSLQPKCPAVREICDAVKAAQLEDRIAFNDGNFDYLAEAKRLIPQAVIFYDTHGAETLEQGIARALNANFFGLVSHFDFLTPERVTMIRAAGLEPGVWTVNDANEIRRFLEMGICRFYTDDPALALKVKHEFKA